MKEKLDRVLGLQTDTPTPTPTVVEDAPFDGGKPMTAEQAAVTPPVAETAGDSDEYSYFAKLAEQE